MIPHRDKEIRFLVRPGKWVQEGTFLPSNRRRLILPLRIWQGEGKRKQESRPYGPIPFT